MTGYPKIPSDPIRTKTYFLNFCLKNQYVFSHWISDPEIEYPKCFGLDTVRDLADPNIFRHPLASYVLKYALWFVCD